MNDVSVSKLRGKRVTRFGGAAALTGTPIVYTLSPSLTGVVGYRLFNVYVDATAVVFNPANSEWAVRSNSLSGAVGWQYSVAGNNVGSVVEWFDPRDALQITGHYYPNGYKLYDMPREIAYFDLAVTTIGGAPVTCPGASVIGLGIEFLHDYQ